MISTLPFFVLSEPELRPVNDYSAQESLSTTSSFVHSKKDMKFTELLQLLPLHPADVSLEVLVEFYENLKGNYLVQPDDLQHPQFNVLREATENLSQQLNTTELQDILIALLPSKAVMHDKLTQIVANAMFEQATSLSFHEILLIDFLIHKYYKTSELSEDHNNLRLKLQEMFLSKISNEIQNNRLSELEDIMKIVAYCQNNAKIIPLDIMRKLIEVLLRSDDEKFSVVDIASVFTFIANLDKSNKYTRRLLRKMFRLWAKSEPTPQQVEVLLAVLAKRSAKTSTKRFNDIKFIQKCVDSVTQEEDPELLLRVKISFDKLVNRFCFQ